MSDLVDLCRSSGRSIGEIARENEESARDASAVDAGLDAVWTAMAASIDNGLRHRGVLPGSLGVRRRAADIREQLERETDASGVEPSSEWLGVYALAVNEENAAGGRIVTAPTNGAGGVVPAVAMYWWRFLARGGSYDGMTGDPTADARRGDTRAAGIRTFLLTATAVGSIIKANASISGAEGGCQAEIGSACAMAAAGLTAVLGGTPSQIENAAEIAVEHHLGLTCDPVAGLVQIPCIERNAIAASTAVAAARLALRGDGSHRVPLDVAVETMRQTGADMSTKYKETSAGGLAVNVIEC
jgi:L-serine dehydratase